MTTETARNAIRGWSDERLNEEIDFAEQDIEYFWDGLDKAMTRLDRLRADRTERDKRV